MTQGMLMAYLIAFFVVGVGVSAGVILWAIGPVGRKIGWAYLRKKPMIQFPKPDKQWEFVEVDRVKDNGEYVIEGEEGEIEYTPDPKDVYIAGNKIPLLTGLRNIKVSSSPFKAFSAEVHDENPDTDGWVEWKGKDEKHPLLTVCWEPIREKAEDMFSPTKTAAMWATSMNVAKDWESPKKEESLMGGATIKIAGIAMVVILVIVGLFIASNMGYI